MNNLTTEQKESLRHATLEGLATRAPAALSLRQLAKVVKKDVDFLFAETDLEAAAQLLTGLGLTEVTVDDFGATKYWRATSRGVLDWERR